jgi:hypothetical protein
MSKKTTLFIFSIGAAAGWTAAKFSAGDSHATLSDSWQAPDWPATPEHEDLAPAEEPQVDPFSGAFQGALAEVRARSKQQAEQDREVA